MAFIQILSNLASRFSVSQMSILMLKSKINRMLEKRKSEKRNSRDNRKKALPPKLSVAGPLFKPTENSLAS
jgi:hypothetical protein